MSSATHIRLPFTKDGVLRTVQRFRSGSCGTGLQIATILVFMGAALNVFDPFEENTAETRPERRSVVAAQDAASLPHAPAPSASDEVNATEDVKGPEEDQTAVEGELRVISNPSQAHVTVNGIGRGKTPLHVRFLPLGPYRIRVVHPNYRIQETSVTLRPGAAGHAPDASSCAIHQRL